MGLPIAPPAFIGTRGPVTIVHFINRHDTRPLEFKDCEFSRATVTDVWEGGHNDVRQANVSPDWPCVTGVAEGIRVFDLDRWRETCRLTKMQKVKRPVAASVRLLRRLPVERADALSARRKPRIAMEC